MALHTCLPQKQCYTEIYVTVQENCHGNLNGLLHIEIITVQRSRYPERVSSACCLSASPERVLPERVLLERVLPERVLPEHVLKSCEKTLFLTQMALHTSLWTFSQLPGPSIYHCHLPQPASIILYR